ncbi:Serine--tRNA ligase, mitochondrial [Cyphellophora attinorum]|uniref:serine--tRNA ligase n=1 Tax=Cyphellophora attinorum TaxID=1664694 RepID=A0A0N1HIH9_9EURO|nr:Serine--tRNA ligase, mitochondrial [Phialophora attinorum]KPI35900.1 Serine--tRNA ligase, mitochondrial [Phialophora attinorum]
MALYSGMLALVFGDGTGGWYLRWVMLLEVLLAEDLFNVELYSENARIRNYLSHVETPAKIAAAQLRINEINELQKSPRQQIKKLEKQLHDPAVDRNEILAAIKEIRPTIDRLVQEQDANSALAHGIRQVLEYINYDPASPPSFDPGADHSKIGEALDLIEFAAAGQASGWGFYYLLNEGALLEQALVQYALAVARKRGWMMITPPSLVYSHMAESCGFQPRDQNDEQQIWQVAQPEKDAAKPKRSLAATAEIPLAGLYASKAIPEDELPIKVIGSSRCYRAEAGARGVDTKGLYRVHEFTKVEMFAWADGTEVAESGGHSASQADLLFLEMVEIQKEILSSLGLPFRILEMPASDLGASAFRKIDIEAVFPSRMSRDDGWGELTSVSMCTDYQSRRLDTRIFDRSGSRKRFAHTLNGTAMAVPRVLAAILEHGWRQEEKCVMIPQVLVPYMGGLDRITAQSKSKR